MLRHALRLIITTQKTKLYGTHLFSTVPAARCAMRQRTKAYIVETHLPDLRQNAYTLPIHTQQPTRASPAPAPLQ